MQDYRKQAEPSVELPQDKEEERGRDAVGLRKMGCCSGETEAKQTSPRFFLGVQASDKVRR